jgi:hypothetical protein
MSMLTQIPAFDVNQIEIGKTVRVESATFEPIDGSFIRDVIILEVDPNALSFTGVFFNPTALVNQNYGRGFGSVYADKLEKITIRSVDVFSNLIKVSNVLTEDEFLLLYPPEPETPVEETPTDTTGETVETGTTTEEVTA